MFRTLTTSRPARLLAAAGVLGLLATGCTSNTPEADAVRLERPGRRRQRQRRPRREGHHRLLRPGGRPRLARRRQQLREGGGREVLGHRLQDGGGHQRRQPADQPDRDLHQRQGRRDRAAARPTGPRSPRSPPRRCRPASPVVNVDREFSSPFAARTTVLGDNYGMGVSAGTYACKLIKDKKPQQPGHRRDRRHRLAAADPGPQQGLSPTHSRRAARPSTTGSPPQFTVESGEKEASNLLQAAPKIDILWNHDDDQGVGVQAALDNANRHEMAFIGGAGSANAMRAIKEGKMEATVIYPPTQAADGVRLARLLVQEQGHVATWSSPRCRAGSCSTPPS